MKTNLLELPVYGDVHKYTSDHSTHLVWVKPEHCSKIEEMNWGEQFAFQSQSAFINPEDRPDVCLAQFGSDILMVAMKAKDLLQKVSQKVQENKKDADKERRR